MGGADTGRDEHRTRLGFEACTLGVVVHGAGRGMVRTGVNGHHGWPSSKQFQHVLLSSNMCCWHP